MADQRPTGDVSVVVEAIVVVVGKNVVGPVTPEPACVAASEPGARFLGDRRGPAHTPNYRFRWIRLEGCGGPPLWREPGLVSPALASARRSLP